MKIEKMKAARKRGADMTQALLYAAFAIVVLISVLAMYQVVTLNSNKTAASRTVSTAAQEARTLYRNSVDFDGLTNTVLVRAGAVPTDAIGGTEAAPTITLPYQGTVEFTDTTDGKFQAEVSFDTGSRGAKALCTFLSSGATPAAGTDPAPVITGPMGAEYSASGANTCASDAPAFTVVYER